MCMEKPVIWICLRNSDLTRIQSWKIPNARDYTFHGPLHSLLLLMLALFMLPRWPYMVGGPSTIIHGHTCRLLIVKETWKLMDESRNFDESWNFVHKFPMTFCKRRKIYEMVYKWRSMSGHTGWVDTRFFQIISICSKLFSDNKEATAIDNDHKLNHLQRLQN